MFKVFKRINLRYKSTLRIVSIINWTNKINFTNTEYNLYNIIERNQYSEKYLYK